MSELKGFTLTFRTELLVRDHTLVLCLKAALTFKKSMKRYISRLSGDTPNQVLFISQTQSIAFIDS